MKKIILLALLLALALAAVSLAAQGAWTQKADMPTARYACGSGVVDGKIYVIGGWDAWKDLSPLATVEVYDPMTDTWERKADMPTPRGALAAAVLDGKVYAIGGARGESPFSTVEVYDPTTDTWEEKAGMNTRRWFHSAVVVNGRIYAIGGVFSSTIEEYNPDTDTWTRKTSMPFGRWVFGVGVVNGRIYVIGGSTGSPLSSVFEYNPAADSWIQKANMPTARAALSAAVVDGRIYAIGGDMYMGGPGRPNVEVYDPTTDTWEKMPDLPTPRSELSTVVVNGKIYAIGGRSPGLRSTVEEYDPNPLVVDFNGDGKVDCADMCMMVDYWHTDEPFYDIAPPPFGDGIVDVQDLVVLSEYLLTYPGAVAYWKLDETEGIIAHDSVGDNDTFLMGDPAWQPDGGIVDGALQFDGIDDYVSTDFVLNPTEGPFSVVAWVKGGALGQAVLSQMGGARWLCADPSEGNLMTELKATATGRGAAILPSQTNITDGNWHRIGLVWDGSHRTLYVDDIAVAEDTQVNLGGSENGLYIGAGTAMEPGSFWSGLIDDVRIYNRVVTP